MMYLHRLNLDYLKFTGTERLDLLNRMSSAEVKNLGKYNGIKTILTTDKGRFVDLLTVYNPGEFVLASCSYRNARRVIEHLDRYTVMDDFKAEDLSGIYSSLLLFGEDSAGFAKNVLGVNPDEMANNDFLIYEHSGVESMVCHNDDAFGGFLMIFPAEMNALFESHVKDNSVDGIHEISDEEYETKRIELGIPEFGKEMTVTTNPLECGLAKYVNFKKGCYIGQEVIARLDTYDKVSKHITGLKSDTPISGPFSNGTVKITKDGKECGFVTSSAHSEKYGSIGLGFVKTPFLEYGPEYGISAKNTVSGCRLVELPFK